MYWNIGVHFQKKVYFFLFFYTCIPEKVIIQIHRSLSITTYVGCCSSLKLSFFNSWRYCSIKLVCLLMSSMLFLAMSKIMPHFNIPRPLNYRTDQQTVSTTKQITNCQNDLLKIRLHKRTSFSRILVFTFNYTLLADVHWSFYQIKNWLLILFLLYFLFILIMYFLCGTREPLSIRVILFTQFFWTHLIFIWWIKLFSYTLYGVFQFSVKSRIIPNIINI